MNTFLARLTEDLRSAGVLGYVPTRRMMRIQITPHWGVSQEANDEDAVDTTALLTLLAAIQDSGAIAQAARSVGLSYRHAWGQVKRAELLFGHRLVDAGRGRGSTLTPLAEKLIWADRRITARLAPMLSSLASELEHELDRALPPKEGATAVLRLHASHGFAVAALLERLEGNGLSVELRYRNSFESVAALSRGECDLAGFHVPIGEFQAAAVKKYLQWLKPQTHCLVHLAVRMQGLFVQSGNPKKIRGLTDLSRPDVRFVNRPEGSGTRMLTELLLAKAGVASSNVNGFDSAEFTHAAVAAYIASGMADAGIGVQTAAQRFGLQFIPLVRERYFFAFARNAATAAAMRSALDTMQSPAYRSTVASFVGYEAGETGRVLGVSEAFD